MAHAVHRDEWPLQQRGAELRMSDTTHARRWRTRILRIAAAAIVLLGGAMALGGAWLLALGGSAYYVIAGLAFTIAGIALWRLRRLGAGLFACALGGTIAWSWWEVGFDSWALLPRLLVLGVLGLVVAATFGAAVVTTRAGDGSRERNDDDARRDPSRALTAATGAIAALAVLLVLGSNVLRTSFDPAAEAGAPPPAPPAGGAAPPGDAMPPDDWHAYGRDVAATRYSPLRQIDRSNVARLERVWEYRTRDLPPEDLEDKWAPETTPLKVGDALYLCTPMSRLIALEAATGRERWRYDPGVSYANIPYSATCRGVAYHEATDLPPDAPCRRRVIVGTLDARLVAVDALSGVPCAQFGNGGHVSLLVGMGESVPGYVAVTSPPTIVRGIAVVGHQVLDGQSENAPSGVIRGYDAVTGALAWAWDMGRPEAKSLPPEGETYTRGTPNAWTTFSADESLGLVYVPMGNSAVDYFAGNRRQFEEDYSTALVALDAKSGDVRWSFRTVHRDVWDYDLGSQGTLVDFPTEAGPVPAVILPTKTGQIYVLDRRTGEPLVEVRERPVPQGGVPGEKTLSPTQPYSVGMPSLSKPPLAERDTWGMSPVDQLWCRIQFRRARYDGEYTPPTLDRPWIQFPGYNGGNDWGGGSVDPARGIFVANYSVTPMYDQLITRAAADERGMVPLDEPGGSTEAGGGVPQAGAPYAALIRPWRLPTGLMCNRPPYGGIMAVDLATRRVLWDVPLGTARRNGPFGIPSLLPVTIGTPNNGGAALTAGGLAFIAAATDDLIRAIDVESGEVLWQDALPAGGQATPMTYAVNGRQYVVIVAGGHHFMETPIGDHVVAYALPAGATAR